MTPSSPIKVLVVDGDPEVSRQVAAWLKGEGVQVVAAQDGETGFMRLKKELPQASIIAAQLDKVVGSALCQRIKKNPVTAGSLVFLASEHYASHPELGERAVSMFGADGFLAKPLERESLIGALAPLLKSDAKSAKKRPTETVAQSVSTPASPPPPPQTVVSAPSSLDSLPEMPSPGDRSTKPPVFQGNLQGTPLPLLFMKLFELKRTGVLTLERNRIRRDIFFRNGIPVHATSSLRTENPALMLVRDGIISEEEYSKSLVMMTDKGMGMNEALVSATTLTYEALYEHVRKYELEIMVNAFAWFEGHFDFRPEDRLPDYVPSFDYPLLGVIYEGVGRHYPLKLFSGPVHEHKEEFALRTPQFADLIEQINLDPQKLKFVLLINGQTMVRDLVSLGRDDLYATYRLLWLLQLARMIEFSDDKKTAGDADFYDKATRGEVAKKQLTPDQQAIIMREYYRIKSSNYFRALQVPLTAEKNEIDAAIHLLERQFHPDNLSDYDIRQIQGKLTEILEKARAAHRVLIDPRTRREYRHYLEVQERQRAKDEVLQAEIAFKEGEKALKKSDFTTARDRFEAAIRMKPDEPDYYAFLGWALFQGSKGKPEGVADIKRAKQELGKAIVMNPQSDKAFLILGRVYAGEGNIRFAEEHFEKALKVNPECVPAKVALDLIKRGKEAKAASAPDPGAGP